MKRRRAAWLGKADRSTTQRVSAPASAWPSAPPWLSSIGTSACGPPKISTSEPAGRRAVRARA